MLRKVFFILVVISIISCGSDDKRGQNTTVSNSAGKASFTYDIVSYSEEFKQILEKSKTLSDEETLTLIKEDYLSKNTEFYEKYFFDYFKTSEDLDKHLLKTMGEIRGQEELFFSAFNILEVVAPTALDRLSQFFPDVTLHVVIYLSPFFTNGGQGIYVGDEKGHMPISINVMKDSVMLKSEKRAKIFITHETTHIIHTGYHDVIGGDSGLINKYGPDNLRMLQIALMTEGIATYTSAYIYGYEINDAIFFEEYLTKEIPPVDDIRNTFANDPIFNYSMSDYMSGLGKLKQFKNWFGSNVEEDWYYPEFRSLGYYLGAQLLKDYTQGDEEKLKDVIKNIDLLDLQDLGKELVLEGTE